MVEANRTIMVEVRSGQEFDKARHAAEKALEEIESLFPQVTDIIAGSDFGQDAVKKARAVVDRPSSRSRPRISPRLTEATEALNRRSTCSVAWCPRRADDDAPGGNRD